MSKRLSLRERKSQRYTPCHVEKFFARAEKISLKPLQSWYRCYTKPCHRHTHPVQPRRCFWKCVIPHRRNWSDRGRSHRILENRRRGKADFLCTVQISGHIDRRLHYSSERPCKMVSARSLLWPHPHPRLNSARRPAAWGGVGGRIEACSRLGGDPKV